MQKPRDLITDLGLLALAVIWGVNFSVVKAVLDFLDPLVLNALRFPLAAAVHLLGPLDQRPAPAESARHLPKFQFQVNYFF